MYHCAVRWRSSFRLSSPRIQEAAPLTRRPLWVARLTDWGREWNFFFYAQKAEWFFCRSLSPWNVSPLIILESNYDRYNLKNNADFFSEDARQFVMITPELWIVVEKKYRKTSALQGLKSAPLQLRCFACLPLWIVPLGDQMTPFTLVPPSTLSRRKPKEGPGIGSSPNLNCHLSSSISQPFSLIQEGQSSVWKHTGVTHRCQCITREKLSVPKKITRWMEVGIMEDTVLVGQIQKNQCYFKKNISGNAERGVSFI